MKEESWNRINPILWTLLPSTPTKLMGEGIKEWDMFIRRPSLSRGVAAHFKKGREIGTMNKKTLRIAGWALGLSMAVAGIGAAVGASYAGNANEPSMVKAAGSTYNFSSLPTSGWTTKGGSQTINSIVWTYSSATYIGNSSSRIQVGSKKNPQTTGWTIQTPITSFGGDKIVTSVAITGNTTATSATYDISVGGSSVKSGSLTTSSSTYTASSLSVSSGDIVITLTGSANSQAMYLSNIAVTYEDAPSVPTLSLSAASLTLNTADASGGNVIASATGFGDGTKYYLWSTDDENISLENASSNVVTIKPNTDVAGTATVNVKVWGGDVTEANALTDSVAVSIETPKTVAEALDLSGTEGVYTKGIISHIDEVSTSNGNATYYISDDGTRTSELEIYRGKYVAGANFTDEGQIQVGDTVVVYGNITTYNDIVEYGAGSRIISIQSEPRLALSESEIEVTVGTDVEITASPSNFASGSIKYVFDEDECATLTYDGNTITVHGNKAGTHTFTIAGKVGDAVQATVQLAVTVVDPYPTSISRSKYTSYTDTQTFANGDGSITVTYSDGTNATKHLGDAGVKLLISDIEVDANSSTNNYVGSNSAKITYTEQGKTVSTSAYTLTVNVELAVNSFEGVPDYLIIDSQDENHSADIIVNYTSLLGEAEVEIESSNPSKLVVDYDDSLNEYDSDKKTGAALFSITAGNNPGQYSVIATVTYGNRSESKSFSINVRGEAPAASNGKYELVTSLAELENQNYVIAAKSGSSYYGMTRTLSSSKFSGTANALSITNDAVSSDDGDEINFYLSVSGTGETRTVTIKDDASDSYVKYSSSTNVAKDGSAYSWTVSAGINGTFRFTSGTSGRGLIYRDTNVFGGYSTSNVSKGGTEYFDLELFKYVPDQKEPFDLVSDFVSNYMHMSDVSLGNNGDTDACRGDTGYYLTAKKAWNALVSAYEGEEDLEALFESSFADAFARYNAWAVANNDAQPFDGNDTVESKIKAAFIDSLEFGTAENGATIAIASTVVTGLVGVTSFAFLRRKKEDR